MTLQLTSKTDQSSALLAMIDADPALADSTKAKYKAAVKRYLDVGGNLMDAGQLEAHARTLPASGRAFLKAAVGKLAGRLATQAKRQATPENLAQIQAGLLRIEALQTAIHVEKPKGEKVHIWLSADEVSAIMATCDDTIAGRRDRVVLGLLFGAGLRRAEAAALEFEAVSLLPIKGKFRTVIDVKGKGAKDRVIPVADKLADILADWQAEVGPGRVCRSIKRNHELRDSMSAVAIFNVVRRRGALIGRAELAAHDCRRTYAQIGLENGISLREISRLLGHESVETTMRYLNVELNLETTISDYVPL